MAELYIISECYVDTNLLETLVPTSKGYNHQKGCNNVVKTMQTKLTEKAHYLIMISPAVDSFILKCAEEKAIEIEQYGFSSDLKSFTEQTKKVSSKEDATFKKLFQELKKADEAIVLRRVLEYLKVNKYQSDIGKLKAIINHEG